MDTKSETVNVIGFPNPILVSGLKVVDDPYYSIDTVFN